MVVTWSPSARSEVGQRLLVRRDRLGQPAHRRVGVGEVVAADQGVQVIRAQGRTTDNNHNCFTDAGGTVARVNRGGVRMPNVTSRNEIGLGQSRCSDPAARTR